MPQVIYSAGFGSKHWKEAKHPDQAYNECYVKGVGLPTGSSLELHKWDIDYNRTMFEKPTVLVLLRIKMQQA